MAEIELAISKSRVQFVTLHYSFWAEIWCIFLGCIFVGVFTFFCFPPFFVTHADTTTATTSVCKIAKDAVHVKKKVCVASVASSYIFSIFSFSPLLWPCLLHAVSPLQFSSHLVSLKHMPYISLHNYYATLLLIPSCFHRTKFNFTWVTLLLYALGQSVV